MAGVVAAVGRPPSRPCCCSRQPWLGGGCVGTRVARAVASAQEAGPRGPRTRPARGRRRQCTCSPRPASNSSENVARGHQRRSRGRPPPVSAAVQQPAAATQSAAATPADRQHRRILGAADRAAPAQTQPQRQRLRGTLLGRLQGAVSFAFL